MKEWRLPKSIVKASTRGREDITEITQMGLKKKKDRVIKAGGLKARDRQGLSKMKIEF